MRIRHLVLISVSALTLGIAACLPASALAGSSQSGADMVIINPGGGQQRDGSDGLLSVFNGENTSSSNFFSGRRQFAPTAGSDEQYFARTSQWCCNGTSPLLYAGAPTPAPDDPTNPLGWPVRAGSFIGEAGAGASFATSWAASGGGVEVIATSGAVVRVPEGQAQTAFPANAPRGSGSALIRYTGVVDGRSYVIDRAIAYIYPNNFYTENYTFTVPQGNTDPVHFYVGGDAAPGTRDIGRAAMTTSPNRVLYEINETDGVWVAYGEVGSPSPSPFTSGFAARYNDPWASMQRGYGLALYCPLPARIVDSNFCLDTSPDEDHDAGMDIQWTLPAAPGTYTRQMRTIVGFQGQSVTARFSVDQVEAGQDTTLQIEVTNTSPSAVSGVGFRCPSRRVLLSRALRATPAEAQWRQHPVVRACR